MTAREDLFVEGLLASAKDDALSPARKAALATALGMGAAAGAGVAAGAAGAAAASKAKLAFGLAVVKWLGIVTVGGVAVATATTAIVHHERAEQSLELSMRERAPRPTTTGMASPPVALESARVAQTEPATLPSATPYVEPTPPPMPVSTAIPVSPPPRATTQVEPAAPPLVPAEEPVAARVQAAPVARLSAEQRTIETARRAISDGDLVAARRALDAHDAEFAHGVLAPEAEVLRIELLARSGQREAARAAASSLLSRAPSSPYASRLRVIAGD